MMTVSNDAKHKFRDRNSKILTRVGQHDGREREGVGVLLIKPESGIVTEPKVGVLDQLFNAWKDLGRQIRQPELLQPKLVPPEVLFQLVQEFDVVGVGAGKDADKVAFVVVGFNVPHHFGHRFMPGD